MNTKNVLFLALLAAACVSAKPGCLSKTRRLKEAFDTKAWHETACNCPCDSYRPKGLYAFKKNKCVECGHRHVPTPLILMQAYAARQENGNFPTAQEALQSAIQRWKRR